MLHAKIAADTALAPDVRDALEDAAHDIADLRRASVRIGQTKPGSAAYGYERDHIQELTSRIGARAARIESCEMTADGLLAIANAADGQRGVLGAVGKSSTVRALYQRYSTALAREAEAIRAKTAAEADLELARAERRDAEAAYKAHGASALVSA